MTEPSPLISIGMSILNGEETVGLAIASIIAQSFTNWELIIIDDGSSDDSLQTIQSFNDSRIRVYSDGENKGLAARLNEAVLLSHGKYFARMDADDISLKDRLLKQSNLLEGNPVFDLTAASAVTFDNTFTLGGVVSIPESHAEICRRPFNGFHLPHPSWMGRTEWFRRNTYRSVADRAEDQDLLFRTYAHSTFHGTSDILLAYRQDHRPLKKLFLARLTILKCFFSEAVHAKRRSQAAVILVVWPLKMLADILHQLTGLKLARNKLNAVPDDIANDWRKLLVSLSALIPK